MSLVWIRMANGVSGLRFIGFRFTSPAHKLSGSGIKVEGCLTVEVLARTPQLSPMVRADDSSLECRLLA